MGTDKLVRKKKGLFSVLALGIFMVILTACSLDGVKQTASEVQKQAVEISQNEIAKHLEKSLQQKISELKSVQKNIVAADGNLNWEELKKTELGEYVFFNAFNYEYKAVMKGDGTVNIISENTETGEKKELGSYKISFQNGNVTLK